MSQTITPKDIDRVIDNKVQCLLSQVDTIVANRIYDNFYRYAGKKPYKIKIRFCGDLREPIAALSQEVEKHYKESGWDNCKVVNGFFGTYILLEGIYIEQKWYQMVVTLPDGTVHRAIPAKMSKREYNESFGAIDKCIRYGISLTLYERVRRNETTRIVIPHYVASRSVVKFEEYKESYIKM